MPGTPAVPTVEHLVLFRARDGVDSAAVSVWLSGLRSLASLGVVAHLAAAPILRCHRCPAGLPPFTHVLHCRLRTEADLAAYAVHPAHLAVVRELGVPVCDDLLAVDWVAGVDPGQVAVKGGCAARVTLAGLREGAGDVEKGEVVAALGGSGRSHPEVEQVRCGENFSPGRAKGIAVGSIWVVRGLEELDLLDVAEGEWAGTEKEKVNPLLESVIVVDFVVPTASEVSSSVQQPSVP